MTRSIRSDGAAPGARAAIAPACPPAENPSTPTRVAPASRTRATSARTRLERTGMPRLHRVGEDARLEPEAAQPLGDRLALAGRVPAVSAARQHDDVVGHRSVDSVSSIGSRS